jgi:hypothetical protein
VSSAATALGGIGSSFKAQNAAASFAARSGTTGGRCAAAIHERFVNTLGTDAGSYAATEPANGAAAGLKLSHTGEVTQSSYPADGGRGITA